MLQCTDGSHHKKLYTLIHFTAELFILLVSAMCTRSTLFVSGNPILFYVLPEFHLHVYTNHVYLLPRCVSVCYMPYCQLVIIVVSYWAQFCWQFTTGIVTLKFPFQVSILVYLVIIFSCSNVCPVQAMKSYQALCVTSILQWLTAERETSQALTWK